MYDKIVKNKKDLGVSILADNKNDRFRMMFTDIDTGLIHILSKEKITEILLALLDVNVNKANHVTLYNYYTGFNLSSTNSAGIYGSQGLTDEKIGSYYYFRLGQILYYQMLDIDQKEYVENIINRSYKALLHAKGKETIDVIRNAYRSTIGIIPDAAYDMLLHKDEKLIRNRVLNWLLGLSYPEMKSEEYESIIGLNRHEEDGNENED